MKPDCLTCEACCFSVFCEADLNGKDLENIGHPLRNLVVQLPSVFDLVVFDTPPTMRYRQGQCVCLRGLVGIEVQCDIYTRRPESCVSFKAGSPVCLMARETLGVESHTVG